MKYLNSNQSRLLSSLTATVVCALLSWSLHAADYGVTDLGAAATAHGLNNHNYVVGADASGAKLWIPDNTELTSFTGISLTGTVAWAISDAAVIVGQAYPERALLDECMVPYLWFNRVEAWEWSTNDTVGASNHINVYADDEGAEASIALGVDGAGLSVGWSKAGYVMATDPLRTTSFKDTTRFDTPTSSWPGNYSDPFLSVANGVSSNSIVVGSYLAGTYLSDPEDEFSYLEPVMQAYIRSNATMTGLQTLRGSGAVQGDVSEALAVNSAGFVVGYSNTSTNYLHPCAWTNGTPSSLISLGNLTGASSGKAYAVNSSGQVVGISGSAAFIWDSTNGMRNLNLLIDTNAGWSITGAHGINNSGVIVGVGVSNGVSRAVVLKPL